MSRSAGERLVEHLVHHRLALCEELLHALVAARGQPDVHRTPVDGGAPRDEAVVPQAVDEAHRTRMAEAEDPAQALDAQDVVVRRRGQRRRCACAVLDRQP